MARNHVISKIEHFCSRNRHLGERRLLACSRRQLADDTRALQKRLTSSVQRSFRRAAEKNRLAACAPQISQEGFETSETVK
jgi:hypothetical protein